MSARRWVARVLPALALVGAGLLAVSAGEPEPGAAPAWDVALARTWPRAAAHAAGSLVRIRPAQGGPARSGVVVDEGLVVTCATHLSELPPGDLVVEGPDGQTVPARVRGRDLRLRLVALEVAGLRARPLELARDTRPGTFVLVLGSALDPAGTVTSGIVSATGRFDGRALQVDAPLDASNHGGPVVDLEGRLVGVAVRVDERLGDRSGVGFAIPAARVLAVREALRRGEELAPAWIGVAVPRLGLAGEGVLVRGVTPGGPAAAAGIAAGERIVSLGGVPTPHRRAFREALASLWAGQRVEVVLAPAEGGPTRRVELSAAPRR